MDGLRADGSIGFASPMIRTEDPIPKKYRLRLDTAGLVTLQGLYVWVECYLDGRMEHHGGTWRDIPPHLSDRSEEDWNPEYLKA